MADINAIAQEFTTYYYNMFDNQRAQLQGLYRPSSMLTFEGSQFLGVENIMEKLQSLSFEKVVHRVVTLDAQPSSTTSASLIVSVTGQLIVDDNTNPLHFSQIFQLIPEGGGYYVFNDIFRLNYG
ncbi:hypothetical protein EIP86_007942 [Pleurotus ostreatoroseus]|nr:hypothetical protein EIP86_007942 [Pleurotus ostreatoroseus]